MFTKSLSLGVDPDGDVTCIIVDKKEKFLNIFYELRSLVSGPETYHQIFKVNASDGSIVDSSSIEMESEFLYGSSSGSIESSFGSINSFENNVYFVDRKGFPIEQLEDPFQAIIFSLRNSSNRVGIGEDFALNINGNFVNNSGFCEVPSYLPNEESVAVACYDEDNFLRLKVFDAYHDAGD